MVKIRLARVGRKNLASFRVVVNPVRTKQNTHAIEELGFYSPHTKEMKFNNERVTYWLSVGAQPSETVRRLLVKGGVIKATESKKFANKPGKKATERRAAAVEAEAAKVAAEEKAKADAIAAEEAAKLAAETPAEAEAQPEAATEATETPTETEAA